MVNLKVKYLHVEGLENQLLKVGPGNKVEFVNFDWANLESKPDIVSSGTNNPSDVGKLVMLDDRGQIHSSLISNDSIKPWQADYQYYANDIVISENKLYRATADNNLPVFDPEIWIQLTGYLTDETINNHITLQAIDGAHGLPIVTESDDGKVLAIVSNQISLKDPADLNIQTDNVGPNMPEVFTPSNYSSVTQPTGFNMKYYHTLGTTNGGTKIDVYKIMNDESLLAIYTTDWIPGVSFWKIPFGVLDYADWYVAKVKHRDVSGRVSEERIIHFRALPLNNENLYFALYDINTDFFDKANLNNGYVFLSNTVNKNNFKISTKPDSFTYLYSDALWVSNEYYKTEYTDIILNEYNHPDNVPLDRITIRFKDENNVYDDSTIIFYDGNNHIQGYMGNLKPNKNYTLEVICTDENASSTMMTHVIRTFPIDVLYKTRCLLSGDININQTPIYYLNVPLVMNDYSKRAHEEIYEPVITNPEVFEYLNPTDDISINVSEILSFTYSHSSERPLSRSLVRFKRSDNDYHCSQEFFGDGSSVNLEIRNLPCDTLFDLELYVMDEFNNINSTSISCRTMPSGLYNSNVESYDTPVDDLDISSTGILTLKRSFV